MARICESICNAVISSIPMEKGKRRKYYKVADFLPVLKKREPDLTPEQQEYIRKKHGKRRNRLS